MTINIDGRHVELTDALKEKVDGRIAEMLSEFPRMDSVHVVLNKEKHRQSAEIVVHVPRHGQMEARSESHDMYQSVDEAAEKMAVQLRKWADRHHDHKRRTPLWQVDKDLNADASV
jgi:putative sigma-54 modulation protein